MFGQDHFLPPSRRPLQRESAAVIRALVLVAILVVAGLVATLGATLSLAAENPSGLPLPRFVTTRSSPVNVRIGPGTKYGVAWVYVKAGTPVEIIQEFDTWRKIRDADGSEGWLHQNLLQGKRAGLVAPWKVEGETIGLYKSRATDSGVRAWLPPKFRVDIAECDGAWCEVTASVHPAGGSAQSYNGFLAQVELWGVYQDEAFD